MVIYLLSKSMKVFQRLWNMLIICGVLLKLQRFKGKNMFMKNLYKRHNIIRIYSILITNSYNQRKMVGLSLILTLNKLTKTTQKAMVGSMVFMFLTTLKALLNLWVKMKCLWSIWISVLIQKSNQQEESKLM